VLHHALMLGEIVMAVELVIARYIDGTAIA
jgi:hypothetical protein